MYNNRYTKKKDNINGNSNSWMTTYSDLVTLLLTFFIMLFSMAVLDKQKFIEVAQSLARTFTKQDYNSGETFMQNTGKELKSLLPADNGKENKLNENEKQWIVEAVKKMKEKKLTEAKKEIENTITKLNLSEHVTVIDEEHRIILRLDTVILFDLGSATIKEQGQKTIKELGLILNKLDNDTIINGHTCDLPINTPLYPTNWELSTRRASNVARFLIEECEFDPSRLTACGHAEFKPLKPNTSAQNRQKNRRIEIFIEKQSSNAI